MLIGLINGNPIAGLIFSFQIFNLIYKKGKFLVIKLLYGNIYN